MTAISGYCRLSGSGGHRQPAEAMIAALQLFGPDDSALSSMSRATFGRCLFRTVPEDRFDIQPFKHPDNWIFVADVRLDNREEIEAALGISRSAPMSDSELFFRAYARWREDAVDHVRGDYACAVWDERHLCLTLMRDPAGQRPLYYASTGDVLAFSSMPQGLHAAGIRRVVDRERLGRFVADIPLEPGESYFENVRRVAPGEIFTLAANHQRARKFWHIPNRQISYPRDEDYEEALLEELDRAVRPRLRGAGDALGTHLSAGLDSSAVTSSAARTFEGGKVTAFTSAPRQGFDGPVPRGRIADESVAAARVAAFISNLDHIIVRPDGTSALDLLDRDIPLLQEPLAFPCNYLWWSNIHEAASAQGIRVMLTGQAGNLTLSAGGIAVLSSLVHGHHWSRWVREARLVRRGGNSLRGVLAASFGPWLPAPVWNALLRAASAEGVGKDPRLFLAAPVRELILSDRSPTRGGQPPRDERLERWQVLTSYDPANFRKTTLSRYGIDERDPTADRRFAEFCFSLPPEQLFRGGITRRLARRALARDLPAEAMNSQRGYQACDWYETLSRDRARGAVAALRDCAEARSLIDFDRLDLLVDAWPDKGWETWPVISTYRMLFLRVISAATFACAPR